MAYVKYSKDDRYRFHVKRFNDWSDVFDYCSYETQMKDYNQNKKIQYSNGFLKGFKGRRMNFVHPAERFGFWRGQRARKKKDTDLW